MLKESRIAVIVPAYNEAARIESTLRAVPAYVDRIYVVDDGSRDKTVETARAVPDPRVTILDHASNRGVGAAIVTGYCRALCDGCDVFAVMAGDRQMDPHDLSRVLDPALQGNADYVKGNRFFHPERRRMPLMRRMAGRFLGFVTRRTTGLIISDPQCGFTALTAEAARQLPLEEMWPRYGYPNDLLALLAEHGMRITEVPVRPVYAGESSGVRAWHVLLILDLLLRRRLGTRRADLRERISSGSLSRRSVPQSGAHARDRSTPQVRLNSGAY